MTLHRFLLHLVFLAALALLSAGAVRLMISVGVMDHPEGRKAHEAPTPKMGGVGIVLAYLLGIAVLYVFADFARLAGPYFRGMILSAFVIALVAMLDDIFDYPFVIKLATQVVAALAAVGSGLYVTLFHLPYIGGVDVGPFAIPFTLCWILFATNAMNFIDGLNGLSSGVTFITCVFLSIFSVPMRTAGSPISRRRCWRPASSASCPSTSPAPGSSWAMSAASSAASSSPCSPCRRPASKAPTSPSCWCP